MKTNREIQHAARVQLRDRWLMAAVATLVYVVIYDIFTLLTGGPMNVGYARYLREVKNGDEGRLETLFDGFQDFVRALVALLVVAVIIFIGSLLLIVPGIIAALGLSMTWFILAEDRDIEPIAALQRSWNMMRGHKARYLGLVLRFIGWLLLCVVTLGIAAFWVIPYMKLAAMNFYDELKMES